MSGWFGDKKENPVEAFRKDLMQAVKDGDLQQLAVLMVRRKTIDLPRDALNDALKTAVKRDQIQCAQTLIEAGAEPEGLSDIIKRDVVDRQHKAMFRLLRDRGVNFGASAPETGRKDYLTTVAFLEKDHDYDLLKAEFDKLKAEMTGSGPKPPSPAKATPAGPQVFRT